MSVKEDPDLLDVTPISSSPSVGGQLLFTVSGSTFGNTFTHHYDIVRKQVESGLAAQKRAFTTLKKICALEEEFAKNLNTLLHNIEKIDIDEMQATESAWKKCTELWATTAAAHFAISQRVNAEVIQPMEKWHATHVPKTKAIDKQRQQYGEEVKKLKAQVQKDRANCLGMLKDCGKMMTKERQAQTLAMQEANTRKDALPTTQIKLKQVFSDKAKSQLEKVSQAATTSQHHIALANSRQTQFFTSDLPALLNSLQMIEEQRVASQLESLDKYGMIVQDAIDGPLKQYAQDIQSTCQAVDQKGDVVAYISRYFEKFGPPHPEPAYVYLLPASPEDIKAGRLEQDPNSIFNTSVKHCMELQAPTHPELRVPRIVDAVISHVTQKGGCAMEGICRLAAGKAEMDKLRSAVDKGNYDMSGYDCHAAVGVLKFWLRALTEPLIPDELYPRVIQLANDRNCTPASLLELVSKFDQPSLAVIQRIAWFCQDVASPANSATSKMTIENLAIIFAPCFFVANNVMEEDLDPAKLIETEIRFTTLLLFAIPHHDDSSPAGLLRSLSSLAALNAEAKLTEEKEETIDEYMCGKCNAPGYDADGPKKFCTVCGGQVIKITRPKVSKARKKNPNSSYEGWLQKEGGRFSKTLQKRYFVLLSKPDKTSKVGEGLGGVLQWYKAVSDKKPAGDVRLAPDQLAIGEDEVQPWIFTLNVGVKKNKTYKLFASSPLDKQTWLREIRTVTFGKAHAAAAEDKTRGTISGETHIDPSEPTEDGFSIEEEHHDTAEPSSMPTGSSSMAGLNSSSDEASPWGGGGGSSSGVAADEPAPAAEEPPVAED